MDAVSQVVNMQSAALMQQVQISVLKKTMDVQASVMESLVGMLTPSNPDHLGQNIDVRV